MQIEAYVATYLILRFFFFNDTATTEIYTLSLHDALPISRQLLVAEGPRLLFEHHRNAVARSEEHTSELQSPCNLVCRLLLEKKKFAQGVQTGTMRGTVKDQQGLAVPGVTVTVTSPALQGQRVLVTGPDGSFTLQSLPPGTYQIQYTLDGFSPVTQTATVPLGGVAEQAVTLRAAGVSEQVQVTAEKPAPIATPVIGENFKHEEIEALATPRTLQGVAQ